MALGSISHDRSFVMTRQHPPRRPAWFSCDDCGGPVTRASDAEEAEAKAATHHASTGHTVRTSDGKVMRRESGW